MESPCFSRPQSTVSHLFARTRSFHRPTYKRPGQKLTRTTQREQIFTHSQWEIISPVSSLKNLPFPIATEQKCSKKVPDSHRREFRVISFEI